MRIQYFASIGVAVALSTIGSVAFAETEPAKEAEIKMSPAAMEILCKNYPLNSRCKGNADASATPATGTAPATTETAPAPTTEAAPTTMPSTGTTEAAPTTMPPAGGTTMPDSTAPSGGMTAPTTPSIGAPAEPSLTAPK
jgi:hypothetical protein